MMSSACGRAMLRAVCTVCHGVGRPEASWVASVMRPASTTRWPFPSVPRREPTMRSSMDTSGASRRSYADPRPGPPRPRSRGAREGGYPQIPDRARGRRRRRDRRCRADGAECDLRDVALKTPAQVLSRDPKRVQEERDALLELRARHDLVDEAVFEEELESLETVRQLLADGLARHACAGEADERARFG